MSQMTYIEDWGLLNREHSSSLLGVTEALKASILRLPVTGGAKVLSADNATSFFSVTFFLMQK